MTDEIKAAIQDTKLDQIAETLDELRSDVRALHSLSDRVQRVEIGEASCPGRMRIGDVERLAEDSRNAITSLDRNLHWQWVIIGSFLLLAIGERLLVVFTGGAP